MIKLSKLIGVASPESKQVFKAYAGKKIERWRELVGQKITHDSLGEGKIIDLGYSPLLLTNSLYIEFAQGVHHFKIPHIVDDPLVLTLTLSKEIVTNIRQIVEQIRTKREDVEQRERERVEALRAEMERKEQERSVALRAAEERRVQLILTQQREDARKAHERVQLIQQICRERDVKVLMHFTRARNVPSILENGLLSRKDLEVQGYNNATFNDSSRFDDCRDAICLSVSFPNYQMFYRFRNQIHEPWIVICIDVRALWELDCAFCRENAASNDIRRITIEQRKEVSSFASMFSDHVGGGYMARRDQLNIPNHYPTHPQAEVLVFGRIDPSYFQAIHFADFASRNQYKVQLATTHKHIATTLSTTYFQPRQDWQFWIQVRQRLTDLRQPETLEDDYLPF